MNLIQHRDFVGMCEEYGCECGAVNRGSRFLSGLVSLIQYSRKHYIAPQLCNVTQNLVPAIAHLTNMPQQLLFAESNDVPEKSSPPKGFVFQSDFLSLQEERDLIAFIQTLNFKKFQFHGVTAKRRVIHFGLHYAFTSRALSPAPALPAVFQLIREKAATFTGIDPADFSETLVTEYQPGTGIDWHRDAPPFGVIVGISLGTGCRMRFRKGSGAQRQTTAATLPPRSIYLLTGEARTLWQHSIAPITEIRYSITFRTLKDQDY